MGTVERAHLVSDIIQNLKMDGSYYENRTITYKLRRMTPLQNLIEQYQREQHRPEEEAGITSASDEKVNVTNAMKGYEEGSSMMEE